MKDNIQNLIKNVIEENAVRAKEQANKALYEKVGNRLKNEYINVSRRLFTSLNENENIFEEQKGLGTGGLNAPVYEKVPPINIPGMYDPDRPIRPAGDVLRGPQDGDTWTDSDGIRYKREGGITYFWFYPADGGPGGWIPVWW